MAIASYSGVTDEYSGIGGSAVLGLGTLAAVGGAGAALASTLSSHITSWLTQRDFIEIDGPVKAGIVAGLGVLLVAAALGATRQRTGGAVSVLSGGLGLGALMWGGFILFITGMAWAFGVEELPQPEQQRLMPDSSPTRRRSSTSTAANRRALDRFDRYRSGGPAAATTRNGDYR